LEAHQVSTIKEKTYFVGKNNNKKERKTINKGEFKVPT
jgi:hypothetical protein